MIGYRLSVHDNDSYAFRERPAIREDTPWYALHQTILPNMSGTIHPGVRRCSKCGHLLAKWAEPLTGLKIKRRRLDISCTYDGVTVVSEAFKAAYDDATLTGLRYVPLPDDPSFFAIQADATIEFDAERRGTRFLNQCPVCGQYESVVGATPVYLKEGSIIPDRGFVRTDIEFATMDEKHPMLLCGPAAAMALKAAKLKGLDLVAF
jgi:hypothetical protein